MTIKINDKVEVSGDDRASRVVVKLYNDADGNARAICIDQLAIAIDVRIEAIDRVIWRPL